MKNEGPPANDNNVTEVTMPDGSTWRSRSIMPEHKETVEDILQRALVLNRREREILRDMLDELL